MSTIDDTRAADPIEPGLWVIEALDRIHERMLTNHDIVGLQRLERLDDEELILLARAELDNWTTTT